MDITSRPFSGSRDLELLKQFVMEIWADESYRSYLHMGDIIWNIYQNTLFDPYRNIRLWQNTQSKLLGFALFDIGRTDFSSWTQIHPGQQENAALYNAMLAWLDERAAEERKEDPSKDLLYNNSYDDDAPLRDALLRHNYQPGDIGMLYMYRELDGILLDPALPQGWQVRHVAGEREFEERVAIHRDVWHPSRVTLQAYQRLRTIPGYTPELDIVAVAPDGTFASYCICWLDPLNRCGEFEPVGTRAAFRGYGIGKAVMLEGLRRLQTSGATSAIVNTHNGNDPARRLYESVGFHVIAEDRNYIKHLD
ncbi:MAG TPA: GNAT family N-acetyltransferase [Ktedonobacteraceae bacterium]|nr:GNAT family N-acetyltransferase [Ktedonobacteraceae bacterium]